MTNQNKGKEGGDTDDGVLTREKFEKWVKDEQERPHEPRYTPLPDIMVDEYLEAGVIPQFVIVSPKSHKKIKAKIAELTNKGVEE